MKVDIQVLIFFKIGLIFTSVSLTIKLDAYLTTRRNL